MRGGDRRSLSVLALAVLLAALSTAALPHRAADAGRCDLAAPTITGNSDGSIHIEAVAGTVHYTLDGSLPDAGSPTYTGPFVPQVDRTIQRAIHTPTSVQWRHPIGVFPPGVSVRACAVDAQGRAGAVATYSSTLALHGLPVVMLTLSPGALFDADSGLYVVGNGVFRTDEEPVQRYPHAQKWWKYPGNFQFKGKRWQRQVEVNYLDVAGRSLFNGEAELRINGNNTRGFPQHALRVTFPEDLPFDLFRDGCKKGARALILRASGNDQDRTFFRDALQHRLCKDLPFETAGCVEAVVYVNGAYWGLHNLRPRMDAREIARRHGVKKKEVTILQDRLELFEGDEAEMKRFARFLTLSERWDASGQAFVDSLSHSLDVENFLTYIAAQVILGNTDWPDQNVKWWRFTGSTDTVEPTHDGRWRFMMGDSDMGLGMATGPDIDLFAHLARHHSPTARLYQACMRSPILAQRFRAIVAGLLEGPLSGARIEAQAGAMREEIAQEMPRHIRRWRRPLTMEAWQDHIDALLTFARERGRHVSAQLQRSSLAHGGPR